MSCVSCGFFAIASVMRRENSASKICEMRLRLANAKPAEINETIRSWMPYSPLARRGNTLEGEVKMSMKSSMADAFSGAAVGVDALSICDLGGRWGEEGTL